MSTALAHGQAEREWLNCRGSKPTGEPCRTPLGQLVGGVLIQRRRDGRWFVVTEAHCKCGWAWFAEKPTSC